MNKKITTQNFVERAKEIHSDKYDYSESSYINSETKIKIKCNICNNAFYQNPYVHITGHGCPFCARERINKVSYSRHKDLEGQKFGMLTPYKFEFVPFKGGRQGRWHCKCDCGNDVIVRPYNLLNGNTESCGCVHLVKGPDNPKYKGYNSISLSYWNSLKNGAKLRDIEFNISIEYAWNIFIKQNNRCALSGEPIYFGLNLRDIKGNVSLDRIDSKKGYVEGNIQWVLKEVNKMKMNISQQRFLELCQKISCWIDNSKKD